LENRQSRALIAYWEGMLVVIFFSSAGRILAFDHWSQSVKTAVNINVV